jgi:hypothetical protein
VGRYDNDHTCNAYLNARAPLVAMAMARTRARPALPRRDLRQGVPRQVLSAHSETAPRDDANAVRLARDRLGPRGAGRQREAVSANHATEGLHEGAAPIE